MISATYADKPLVVRLLAEAFDTNRSINYIVKQDDRRNKRIKVLMEYSFDRCFRYGSVLLSNNKDACALLLFPDKKNITVGDLVADFLMVIRVSGLFALKRIMDREKSIKKNYPPTKMLYLWFLAVSPRKQGKGLGKELLGEIIKISAEHKLPIYLETSMPENLTFYKKMGFEVYNEIDFSYNLFLLRRNIALNGKP